jgi:ribosomal protein L35
MVFPPERRPPTGVRGEDHGRPIEGHGLHERSQQGVRRTRGDASVDKPGLGRVVRLVAHDDRGNSALGGQDFKRHLRVKFH